MYIFFFEWTSTLNSMFFWHWNILGILAFSPFAATDASTTPVAAEPCKPRAVYLCVQSIVGFVVEVIWMALSPHLITSTHTGIFSPPNKTVVSKSESSATEPCTAVRNCNPSPHYPNTTIKGFWPDLHWTLLTIKVMCPCHFCVQLQ